MRQLSAPFPLPTSNYSTKAPKPLRLPPTNSFQFFLSIPSLQLRRSLLSLSSPSFGSDFEHTDCWSPSYTHSHEYSRYPLLNEQSTHITHSSELRTKQNGLGIPQTNSYAQCIGNSPGPAYYPCLLPWLASRPHLHGHWRMVYILCNWEGI
jgi:hypothetical protein